MGWSAIRRRRPLAARRSCAAATLSSGQMAATRTITASVPVRVDYELTPLGSVHDGAGGGIVARAAGELDRLR